MASLLIQNEVVTNVLRIVLCIAHENVVSDVTSSPSAEWIQESVLGDTHLIGDPVKVLLEL